MNFEDCYSQIWLAKYAGCLAGSEGFGKSKAAEIQPSCGDERFFRGAHRESLMRLPLPERRVDPEDLALVPEIDDQPDDEIDDDAGG